MQNLTLISTFNIPINKNPCQVQNLRHRDAPLLPAFFISSLQSVRMNCDILFHMAKKKKKFRLRAGYVILAFLLLVCILGGVYLSQETRIETIAAEKATLQSELDKLKVEEERLERTLEYMGTNDYLLQYAREKLGYVYSNDIKFVE